MTLKSDKETSSTIHDQSQNSKRCYLLGVIFRTFLLFLAIWVVKEVLSGVCFLEIDNLGEDFTVLVSIKEKDSQESWELCRNLVYKKVKVILIVPGLEEVCKI